MAHYPSDPYQRGAANRDSEEEALAWVVRLSSGDATDGDRAEFDLWCRAAENATAYRRARLLWLGLRDAVVALPGDDEAGRGRPLPLRRDVTPIEPRNRVGRRGPGRMRRFAIAAALALTFAGGAAQYVRVWQFDHTSGPMSMHRTTLADGSTVTLTPDTAIDTIFQNGSRHVALARGEAFFDVRRDPARPFVVSAGHGVVRVLGTAFSVRRDADGRGTVVVRRGRVEVRSGERSVILTPDRAVSFTTDGLQAVRAVSAEQLTAWERGRLVMENQPLAKVVAEINRYGNRRVVLLNEEAGRRRVDAVVELAQIDSWLAALAGSQGLYRTSIGPITILR
jgi:transmembrane sensor